jgi:hypothetical protein
VCSNFKIRHNLSKIGSSSLQWFGNPGCPPKADAPQNKTRSIFATTASQRIALCEP